MKIKIGLVIGALIAFALVLMRILRGANFQVLNPAGTIALQERNLIYFTLALSVCVVVPVFIMLFWIAWTYRSNNTKATYSPDWDHDKNAETIWWVLPALVILVLSVVAWNSSHALDPYKSLSSSTPPLTVQVVALDWKWLFIYPSQHIASVNQLMIPQNTPVQFEITSDAPMNSFWVPQLGGQIYAMPGMVTKLSLEASKTGSYRGVSANISGTGFANMDFMVTSVSSSDFSKWVTSTQQSPQSLTTQSYAALAKPGTLSTPSFYTMSDSNLYDTTVMKFMAPASTTPQSSQTPQSMAGMNMGAQ